ncbi:AAAP amino acid permease [Roridomyces roridus]|uniref:AAAP amino acid permease n=1 Tax=Roridomyces roridus TaxID=1738132 RepID=A0AAD7CL66_9AGAR|nr:AAAP amino acid permease [Roridomyces roridus]
MSGTDAGRPVLHNFNAFEFAGWGSFSQLTLTPGELSTGDAQVRCIRDARVLGQWTGTALPGNAVLGSVFYALPAVVSVCGVYSPIALFVATLIPFIWRPIMEELVSALPIRGAPYSYILNVSRKPLALFGAALLLLDFAATSVVSASTASAYIPGELCERLPFPLFVSAALILLLFALVSLTGLRESARIALGVLSFHHLFDGICLGMLGLTGIECAPSYTARIQPGRFPLVLRNLHLPAIVLNTLMITLVLALSAGRWLRTWIVVDAAVVLCGGVLTGILSACELIEQLAHDRVLPRIFLFVMPLSGAPYLSILAFTLFCAAVYTSAGANLAVLSKMFSLVWLTVMGLFPLALLLLRFNRPRLPRERSTGLGMVLIALAVTPIVFAGNVAIDPSTAGYFAAYLLSVLLLFLGATPRNQVRFLRTLYWAHDQYHPGFQRWRVKALVEGIKKVKRQPVCILAKTDEISYLLRMLLYVRENEETSCVKLVHFNYSGDEENAEIPSELEANAKILGEAFPEITIDLIIVQDTPFSPPNVAALANRLNIPTALMFMGCPGAEFPYPVADFEARIVSL